MQPGKPQILTCPFCGKEKEIMSLMSGNTFGSMLWSDNKQIAPMMPEMSYVQKCPHCGKYYIRNRQAIRHATEGFSFEQGTLTFTEMKEAFAQLSAEGFNNCDEEQTVRMMLHHAFNDHYHRTGNPKPIDEADKALFHDNAMWLIDNFITDNLLKAEFYRETGEMEKARQLLSTVAISDGFMQGIRQSIAQRIDSGDTAVFLIR